MPWDDEFVGYVHGYPPKQLELRALLFRASTCLLSCECSARRHSNIPSPWFRCRCRYGKDKTPWFYELLHSSLQVPLVALRDVFTVHLGHATTPARSRFTGVTQSTGGLSKYVKTSKLHYAD